MGALAFQAHLSQEPRWNCWRRPKSSESPALSAGTLFPVSLYSWVLVRKAANALISKLKCRLSQQANWSGTLEKIRFGRQVWKAYIWGFHYSSWWPLVFLTQLGRMFCYHRCSSGSVEMQVTRGSIRDSQSRTVGASAREAGLGIRGTEFQQV